MIQEQASVFSARVGCDLWKSSRSILTVHTMVGAKTPEILFLYPSCEVVKCWREYFLARIKRGRHWTPRHHIVSQHIFRFKIGGDFILLPRRREGTTTHRPFSLMTYETRVHATLLPSPRYKSQPWSVFNMLMCDVAQGEAPHIVCCCSCHTLAFLLVVLWITSWIRDLIARHWHTGLADFTLLKISGCCHICFYHQKSQSLALRTSFRTSYIVTSLPGWISALITSNDFQAQDFSHRVCLGQNGNHTRILLNDYDNQSFVWDT